MAKAKTKDDEVLHILVGSKGGHPDYLITLRKGPPQYEWPYSVMVTNLISDPDEPKQEAFVFRSLKGASKTISRTADVLMLTFEDPKIEFAEPIEEAAKWLSKDAMQIIMTSGAWENDEGYTVPDEPKSVTDLMSGN